MTPPRLLILKRLLDPSLQAQNTVEEIKNKLPTTESESIELKGVFVFLVSALETMLTDTHVYFLQAFPEAFDFKDAKFSKDEILACTLPADLIERQIEKNAITLAYGSFPDLLKAFTKSLGIAEPALDQATVDRVIEIKETRNILLHNKLVTNRLYISRAGPFRRSEDEGRKLPLTAEYVNSACESVSALIEDLQIRMRAKYSEYTRIAAFRRLWDFLFCSPLLKFDDYWRLDEEKDQISSLKQSDREHHLSSSEQSFLAVWRMHFNGWNKPQGVASLYGLVGETQQKMLWFLSTLTDFDLR